MAKKSLTSFAATITEKNYKPEDGVFIKGARSNNLKNISVFIPRDQLVVVTGVSGSGKSSITMDTLFAEGQRRYVESLSSYARQFLMRMKKPDVDFIKGISPAIAIEQKVSTSNARSTVGTLTEIYDYLRLLFARVGKTISPISGELVKKHEVQDVVDFIHKYKEGTKVQLFIPLQTKYADRTLAQDLQLLLQKSFTRIEYKGKLIRIEDALEGEGKLPLKKKLAAIKKDLPRVLIDRFSVQKKEEENIKRIADSVNTSFYESEGDCIVAPIDQEEVVFNNRFELDGMIFLEPSPHLFNYNNPYGACPKCEGYGRVMGIDENKVIPNQALSIYEGAIACWKGEKASLWLKELLKTAAKFDFPVHRPYKDLSKAERKLVWNGNEHFNGVDEFFQRLEEKKYKIQNRVMLSRYRGRTKCQECDGGRLRPEASYVFIDGKNIMDLIDLPIDELAAFFDKVKFSKTDEKIASRIILEVKNRLGFMMNVGLSYLNINRLSASLSGGETQRINLTRTLGSNLTSSLYILDEPSIGLHPRDTNRLIDVLRKLRDLGNTVIVVEHEEDIISNADYLIDMGPEAGIHGGEVVFAGPYEDIHHKAPNSLTAGYMTNRLQITIPKIRRKSISKINIIGASQHNLRNIDVTFPLGTLTVVSGVSGSGKTTLVREILYPALKRALGEPHPKAPGPHKEMTGDFKRVKRVEMINQNPIGKSSRSNPVTYVKAYDAIRNLMSKQQLSKIRGFQPRHFSFNVEGGRCEACKGEGEQVVEMQFLADVRLECEECKGRRFKADVLDVKYNDRNISEILDLSISEALDFFAGEKEIINKIRPLDDVGLGYIKLGQSSNTLSGGEAQRVKLASFLIHTSKREQVFFIFDEPTTGLHFHDIEKLLRAFNALVEIGHTVLVVEHNLDVIKSADWLIDLGPEAGIHGGELVFQGTPEDLVKIKRSHTGYYLKEKLKAKKK